MVPKFSQTCRSFLQGSGLGLAEPTRPGPWTQAAAAGEDTAVELYFLTHLPGPLLALIFAAMATGLGVGGLVLARHRYSAERLSAHNDIAGVLIAIVGGLYGVLLAFIVAIAWQQFEDASGVADHEALLVESLYRDASRFPAQKAELRADIERYARTVIDDEWTEMSRQRGDAASVDDALNNLEGVAIRMDLSTPQQAALYPEFVSRLSELEGARQERLSAAGSRLPIAIWWVLIVGGVITIGFTYFFGVSNLRVHAVMVGAIAATLGLTLFLIAALELPFTGDLAVRPDSMRASVVEFADLQAR